MVDLTRLSVELLLHTLGYLDSADLLSVARTAKRFQEPAIKCLYRHPQLGCRGRDDENKSTRRWDPIVTLVLKLLQNPDLGKRIRALDLTPTPRDYTGPFETLFPGRYLSQPSTSDLDTMRLLCGLLRQHGIIFSPDDWNDWVKRGDVDFWTHVLFMLAPNLENLRLGPYHWEFLGWWVHLTNGNDGWVKLRELPGLRAVKHLRIDGTLPIHWDWMTLPSLRTITYPGILQSCNPWPREYVTTMESLHTIMSTMSTTSLENPNMCLPPSVSFQYLKALHIGLTTLDQKAEWGADITLGIETLYPMLGNFFERMLPLADTLEILEIRSLDIVKIVETDQRQDAITQLQNFTRLKRLGVPTYFLAPRDVIEFVWDQDHEDALPLANEDHILDLEALPSTLEVLSIFPDGGVAPCPYSEGVSRILPCVLGWRDRVPNLKSIRIDYQRWKAGATHELPETALIRAGMRAENLSTPELW